MAEQAGMLAWVDAQTSGSAKRHIAYIIVDPVKRWMVYIMKIYNIVERRASNCCTLVFGEPKAAARSVCSTPDPGFHMSRLSPAPGACA